MSGMADMADMAVALVVPQGMALAVGACAVTLGLGVPLPALLRRLGAGKIVREEEPSRHQLKTGTPSMAGLLFTGAAFALAALFVAPFYPSVWLLLALLVATSALGLVDDLASSTRYQRGGMRARVKFGWLLLIAGVAVALAQLTLRLPPIHVPFARTSLALPPPLYWLLGVFVVVGTANAVNLTDGLDGLAGGTSAIAAAAYAAIALAHGQDGVALCLLALVGALLGFLWHNVHPARFFMGDTGALALGAALAGAALLTGDIIALPVVGAVFVAEALSVIIQVAYFRRTGGRRLFRMSPLHLHFELGGWPETRVVQRFWLAGALAALAGIGLALT